MWARANAVQNNNTSVVTFLNDHSFQIFNDANGNGSVDANETTTVDLQTDYSDVTFTVTGSSSTPTFTGRGTAASDTTVTISNPSVTTYMVENLAAGTYEFVATAFNSQNVESDHSASATITVP